MEINVEETNVENVVLKYIDNNSYKPTFFISLSTVPRKCAKRKHETAIERF